MRMNQDERRFDFHGLGAALKRAREEKGWTQAYVAELVDRDSRTIMREHPNDDVAPHDPAHGLQRFAEPLLADHS